ncbi:nucleotidyltransferase domain-containing protein [Paenibacillus senegalensis]|uniref:nucleotidyltransferase domain-containing protein n=1 Tax=Paenibacillus senegalensis TaxID=1465766 RepID=UPI00028899E5|nr:nucleotidyltransferase domain-containing protein [Paenibacillus senegalensis]
MAEVNVKIQEELRRIEEQENVRILYACESGSRAWGFPSRDSDYDVRFLYVRPVNWYLSIFEKRDVIERPIDNMLDINGWDLKKALNLFRKSNPPLLEWLQSPIVYLEQGSAAGQIRHISPAAFSPRSCLYHYLHMAKGNYREYLQGNQVKLKKYFYVLRPILACEWIEQYSELPPMRFQALVERLVPEGSELHSAIQTLLARKITGEELDYEPRVDCINEFVEERIAYFEKHASAMETAEGNQDQQLDELFRSVVREAWN